MSKIVIFELATLGICGVSWIATILLWASREAKILTVLCAFLIAMLAGLVKPTGAELAGLGVFLAGFTVLYRALMKGTR